MNRLLKAGCLMVYLLAVAGVFMPLPYGTETLIRYVAACLLIVHALEAVLMFRLVHRYPGGLMASLVLTLLFGILHWWQYRSQQK